MDISLDRPRLRFKPFQMQRPKEGGAQQRSYPLKRHSTNANTAARVQWWFASPPSDTLSDDSSQEALVSSRPVDYEDGQCRQRGPPQGRGSRSTSRPRQNANGPSAGGPGAPAKGKKNVGEGRRPDPDRHLPGSRSPSALREAGMHVGESAERGAGRADQRGSGQRQARGRQRDRSSRGAADPPKAPQLCLGTKAAGQPAGKGGAYQPTPPRKEPGKNGQTSDSTERGVQHQGGDHHPRGGQAPSPCPPKTHLPKSRRGANQQAVHKAAVGGHERDCPCKCCQWQKFQSMEGESGEEFQGAGGPCTAASCLTEDESEISSTAWTSLFQSQFQIHPRATSDDDACESDASSDRSTLKFPLAANGSDQRIDDTDTDTDWDWEPSSSNRTVAMAPLGADDEATESPPRAEARNPRHEGANAGSAVECGQPQDDGKNRPAASEPLAAQAPRTTENPENSSGTKLEFQALDTRPSWASMDSLLTTLCRQPAPERSQSWNNVSSCLDRDEEPDGDAEERPGDAEDADGEASSADESDAPWVIQHLGCGRRPETTLGPRTSRSMPLLAAPEEQKLPRSKAMAVWDSSEAGATSGMMGRLYEGLVNKSLRKITSDFAVVVGERLFPVHKFVLHAHSGFFREVLQREEMHSSMHFKLEGVREDVFQNFHNFMYLGELKVTHEDFLELLAVANKLQMKDVPNVLLEFLEGSFDLTNAMALHDFNEEAECHPLMAKSHRLLVSNFSRIVDDYYFLKVHIDKLLKILNDDCLVVQSEVEVYRAAQSWMLYDWKNRKGHTEELMRSVRFALLPDEMLLACLGEMEKWNLLETGNINKLMMDALKYKMYKRLGHTYSSKGLNSKSRNGVQLEWSAENTAPTSGGGSSWQLSTRDSPVILIIGGAEKSQAMHAYNPSKEEWQKVGFAPKPWSQAGIVELNGMIYVCGGHDLSLVSSTPGYCVSSQTWCCDVSNGTWSQLAQLKTARVNHAALVCKGKIYAVGGMDGSNRILNSVECYDPLTEQWTQKPNMPEGCVGMASSEFQGLLWICGGVIKSAQGPHNQGIITDLVQVYNAEKDKWYTSAKLRIPRAFACLANVNNRLYLIGGKSPSQVPHQSHTPPRGISDVDLLDVTNNTWNHFTDLILPRHCCCAMTIGRHLYIVGGMSSATGEVLPFVERLDVVSRSLVRLSPELPVKLLGIGGVVLPANPATPNRSPKPRP